jgi:ParB-like chromosome segregation protein Spo0J
MQPWPAGEIRSLPLESIDERYRRYRLADRSAERAIRGSLERYGQLSPVVVSVQEGQLVLVDGFKRLQAARTLKNTKTLSARCLEVDEQGAKAAIYTLNRISRPPRELEEAWIVHSLVREDGLSQVEAAELLGRHKSWVNRRLAMWERLAEPAKEELRLGLLSPSMARQLTRLPVGNQAEALATAREASLTSTELGGVVDLLLASTTGEQKALVLKEPRRALRQAQGQFVHHWDPRLSTEGNRAARQLAALLDRLAKMYSWLRYSGRSDLMACDREPLVSGFERLAGEATAVAEATEDFLAELKQP